ncbi:GTP-binding protein [Grosmannia clavigera kw1407]|uniref:GTP-binding protein n=1 Tax=Grosmannia clavigera (strain kw1407 / UAMH 11150) TaxID=655863 RepID=F0XKU3_GROCL|nr:GTP-binding protein [Grosmannia clavigera kw1407]EFX01845.1 GTP-binding protein [Grosmannia clavigera kw1407]
MAGTINKPKKPTSKRQPVRLRHRIEKASLAKQRKQRKLAKSNPEWRSKLKKDPGIPNLFPYKEKLLHQIEETRLRKQEEAKRRRELAKSGVVGSEAAVTGAGDDDMSDGEGSVDGMEVEDGDVDEGDVDESNPMAALLASARAAARDYNERIQDVDDWDAMDGEDDSENDREGGVGPDDHVIDVPGAATSRKAYDKVFKQVVEQADVVLYVLDARDPEGTRSRDVERAVLAAGTESGKRLILVLNKADLVPPAVLKAWLTHLRGSFPTLPLRASGAAANAHTFHHRDLTVQSTSGALFRALKAYATSRNLKRAVSVGVIGYPNVGKSSVINALLSRLSGNHGNHSGRAACPAGAEAGVTTAIRSVKIDSKLTLLDSPGIVFPSAANTAGSNSTTGPKTAADVHASLILLNAVPPKLIEDPVPAVSLLLKRLSASADRLKNLADVYDLPALMPGGPDGSDITTDFLVQVARKRGRLGRGGVPNIHAAAMTVITDWRDGRIQGWVDAPRPGLAQTVTTAETGRIAAKTAKTAAAAASAAAETPVMADQKQIVTEWAKEFKLDGLWGDEETGEADAMAE